MWFKVYDHFVELKISQKPKGRLSLWDTNAGSNFCDPHLELIWRNKWHLETLEVSTSLEITVGTHFHMWHGTKTTPVFLPVDGEASCLLLPKLISVLSSSTVQPENLYSCIVKAAGWAWSVLISWKRQGVRLVDVMKHLPYKVSLLWNYHEKCGQPWLKKHFLPMR